VVTSSAIRPWTDELGELRAQVLVGVTNTGGTPGFLPQAATTYEIRSPDGVAVARGRFGHVFPPLVEPGERTWFVDAISAAFTDPTALAAPRVVLDERAATPRDLVRHALLHIDGAQWEVDQDGRVTVSGVVVNAGTERVERWSAGVILLDARGVPVAAAYEIGDDRPLEPGQAASFRTDYPGSGPIDEGAVATIEAVAVALD
jgi:hypothetical protein